MHCRKAGEGLIAFVDGDADTQSAKSAADEKDPEDLMLSWKEAVYYVVDLIHKTKDDFGREKLSVFFIFLLWSRRDNI